MKRSLRDSTAKSRERSAEVHQGHLEVKLWNAVTKGRLDEVLTRLEKYKYDAKFLGSIMLEFLFRRNLSDIRIHEHDAVMRVVKRFVFHGADMYAVHRFGIDMVSTAMWTRDTDLTRYIIENTKWGIHHHDTTRSWHQPRMFDVTTTEMAKLMREYGADVSKLRRGNSPLLQFQVNQMYSWYHGYPDGEQFRLIRFLVEELKCEVNECDQSGETALHSAVGYFGETDILHLLLDHGADVHAVDNHGRTPLFPAVQSGRLDQIQILCENGADISTRDVNMLSVLDVAARINVDARSPEDTQRSRLVLEYLDAELTRRETTAAFAMGYHERLGRKDVGKPSPLLNMSPDILRCILENGGYVNKV
jgi:hypothetical protein